MGKKGRPSPCWASLLIPDKVVGPCGLQAPPFLGVSFPKNQQCLSGTREGRWLAFQRGGEVRLLYQLAQGCLGCCTPGGLPL